MMTIYELPACNMPRSRARVAEWINRTSRRAGERSPRLRPEQVQLVANNLYGGLVYKAMSADGRVFIMREQEVA